MQNQLADGQTHLSAAEWPELEAVLDGCLQPALSARWTTEVKTSLKDSLCAVRTSHTHVNTAICKWTLDVGVLGTSGQGGNLLEFPHKVENRL